MSLEHPESFYTSSDYLKKNPTWDSEDAPWKVSRVEKLILDHQIISEVVCEVGCGSGACLVEMRKYIVGAKLYGYDIAPDVMRFWKQYESENIHFESGDFLAMETPHFDLILMLDVLEHVTDPHDFLCRIRSRADHFIFHFPLDLSASSVVRESPLLHVRRKVGHIHYFTKGLALELLDECGFDVMDYQYTGAAFNTPQAGLKTRLAQLPRRIVYALNKDVGVRLLGGETLMVLAKAT